MNQTVLHLWEGYGVELEYMIVDRDTLSILPATDKLLHSIAGSYEAEIERGDLCWSNELVLHVVELKTNGPAKSLAGLGELFQTHVREINRRLEAFHGRLMPTAMHPWMNPERETRLWPHEYNRVYESYHRIFNCRGHGWSNLQSAHLNLPFADDEEFGALHAAVRLILPILPALCASSPLVECRRTGFLDNRMEFYRTNSMRIPSVSGKIAPEPVYTRSEYEKRIFQVMYDDIRSLDPEGVLHHEWLNARGAIARFDRSAIEIRVLDVQECPQADLAAAYAAASVLQRLLSEEWSGLDAQKSAQTDMLLSIFLQTIRKAENTVIHDLRYLTLFGVEESCSAKELWEHILSRSLSEESEFAPALRLMLEQGSLASRILRRLGGDDSLENIAAVYRELADCLETGRMFSNE